MTVFLYSANAADGRSVTGRIDGASLDAARAALEKQGLRDIVFHTDELSARMRRAHGQAPVMPVTAAQELRARRQSAGSPAFLGRVYRSHWIVWLPLLGVSAWLLYRGVPYSPGAWFCFALTPLALLFPLWAAAGARAYSQLLEASAWARWDDVRRRVGWLRRWGKWLRASVPVLELDMRDACAIAGLGNLDAALAGVKHYEATLSPNSVYYSRVASVYSAARDWTGTAQSQAEALRLTAGVSETIDYASTLVRRLRDADGAQRLLDSVAAKERATLANAFARYTEGMIALERGQAAAARAALQEALTTVRGFANASAQGLADFIQAYLAIAVAQSGDKAQARALLRGALPRLTAHKDIELARRCAAAVA